MEVFALKKKLIGVLFASFLLTACGDDAIPVIYTESSSDSSSEVVIESNDTASLDSSDFSSDEILIEDDLLDETTGYYAKYYNYMLSCDGDNLIFSPESLNSALALYSELLTDEDKTLFNSFLRSKNYLSYKSVDGMKIVNRLWTNSDRNINLDADVFHEDFAHVMSMQDSAKATQEKDQFVADMTDNFIMKTPTTLSDDTLFDAMNVIYFKDKWLGGDKLLDDYTTEFTNLDGSKVDVCMFNDEGSHITKSDNAVSYTMDYENGMTFTIVLPNEGVDLKDVNLDSFISNDNEYVATDVYAKIPEFDAESLYSMHMIDFGLPSCPNLSPDITIEEVYEPEISQVAKIKFDHMGTEAAAVTEVMVGATAMAEPTPTYDFIVNRPFAYFITDTVNDDIAFVGVVRNLEG